MQRSQESEIFQKYLKCCHLYKELNINTLDILEILDTIKIRFQISNQYGFLHEGKHPSLCAKKKYCVQYEEKEDRWI